MIDRLIHEDWLLIFPIVATLVAALILAVAARSSPMKPAPVAGEPSDQA